MGVLVWLLAASCLAQVVSANNPDAKRLYVDLLSNYNKLVRPVVNNTDVLRVCVKLKLSQIIDVNLKNQIMTTNLWVEQSWYDYKLRWEPREYGGVDMLHVPSDHIWRPDIVLYNNADGNYEVTLMTLATVHHNGMVVWQPPVVYKSSCSMDVAFFPYDVQTCVIKLGSWTYDSLKVDLRHVDEKVGSNVVSVGMDLSEFYMSVEWDILEVPAVRNEIFYTCCDEPYHDITFNITMRRKTLFYTVNIIIPCIGITFLTILTFYLPSESGQKVTLSISVLISIHVFFLLIVDIIPTTSLVVSLLGKYLMFAMILVSTSICVTVLVLNVHFRSSHTHRMAPWVKRVFIHVLPKLLLMERPQYKFDTSRLGESNSFGIFVTSTSSSVRGSKEVAALPAPEEKEKALSPVPESSPVTNPSACPPEMQKTCFCARFIAEHTKMTEVSTQVKEDWKYVAMVLDRLFLWIFTLAVLVGTAGIMLQAPTLYDKRVPIDKHFNQIATPSRVGCLPLS